jgi:Xaa-Pro aminopeptidase
MPHASPSDKIIGSGEPIIIDCGARIDGYCSDITRTYCLGEPSDKLKSVYTAVLGAQETVLSTIVPGMTGGEVDLMARSVLKECDLDGYFQHGLGHGVGLEIHELPRLGIHSEDILLQSTVFTVEPGVYIPGWGGVRIEDTVLMEAGGGRSLTKSKKDLTLLYVEG